MKDWLFQVESPLGFTIRCTQDYWTFIVSEKHPVLRGREDEIQQILMEPTEIRRSKKDSNVILFLVYLRHDGFARLSEKKTEQDS